MTKIDTNFCEKAYEVEKNANLIRFFGVIPDGHFCRTKIWNFLFEKSLKKLKKGLDKAKRMWYNTSVKTKQSAPLSPWRKGDPG